MGAQTAVEDCEALETHNIMSLSYMCARCCARTALRNSLRPSPSAAAVAAIRQHNNPPTQQQRRWESTASLNPKISGIVDQISQLTLLETADLVSSLKVLCICSHCKSRPPLMNNSPQKKPSAHWVSSLTITMNSPALISPTCPWVDLPPLRRPHRLRRRK